MFVEYVDWWPLSGVFEVTVEGGCPRYRAAAYQTPELNEPNECVWMVPNTYDVGGEATTP